MSSITIQDYSDRSIVVFGTDTKKYKDKLKEMGGKYNGNLSVGPGWIFSNKKKEEIQSWYDNLILNAFEEKEKNMTENEMLREENAKLKKKIDDLMEKLEQMGC
jgi:hypothetical protein